MGLKTVQVASILDISGEIYMFIQLLVGKSVCYEVLPFVIDCMLARIDSKSGWCSPKHFCPFAALYQLVKCASCYQVHECIPLPLLPEQ